MTTTRIYYSPIFGVFVFIESDKWFMEMAQSGMDRRYWKYIGEL